MYDIQEIEETQEFSPTVMIVSPYSNIANFLRQFVGGIKDDDIAKEWPVIIDCYSKEVGDVNQQIIRLSDPNGMWTEISPVDSISGALLPESVSVNLCDLSNVIDNCPDEMISFWIDTEDEELVINSFLNEEKDIDELEVRLKILDRGFPTRNLSSTSLNETEKVGTITLNATMIHFIVNELNVENSVDGVNIIVQDGKLKFQAAYNGFNSQLKVKQLEDEVYDKDFSVFIPFNVFCQMVSTGHPHDLKFEIYENDLLVLNTDNYNFYYQLKETRPIFDIDMEGSERYFIIDAELMESTMKLMNRLSTKSQISNVLIEYVSDGEADISTSYEDRWSISIRTDLAMLSKESITVDADILQEMVSRTQVDAIQMNMFNSNKICMKLENGLIEKIMHYDHEIFSTFREQKYLEWKEKYA